MIFMMLTATAGVGISVKSLTPRSSDPVAHARLKLALQAKLGQAAFDEQQRYLATAAKAAWSTMNGLQRRQRYFATLSLNVPEASSLSFVEGSSSAGLAYALALYEQWAFDYFERSRFAADAVFATGTVQPSGQIEPIERVHQKLAEVISEAKKKGFNDFKVVLPKGNQEQVSNDLMNEINANGGKIIYASSLVEALLTLLGDQFDGQPLGRWQPFKGLKEFEIEDAMRFFGRERAVNNLYQVVTENQSVTFLTGESGVGKSSLVKAGLIPKWLSENEGGKVKCISARELSLENLSFSLAHIRSLLIGEQECLIFLDQGEALFQGKNDAQYDELLGELFKEAQNSALVRFVIATRIEYLDHYLILAGGAAQIYQLSAELTSTEWRTVVTDQAAFSGLSFEQKDDRNLRDVLVEHALQTPRALPLVEFVLEQLYLRSEARGDSKHLLRFSDYESMGGLNGAIALRADEIVKNSGCSASDLDTLFDFFIGKSSGGVLFIREVSSQVLKTFAHEKLYSLVESLKDAGLVVSVAHNDQNVSYRFVHESLLSSWQTIKEWVEGNSAYLSWRTRIDADLQIWLRESSRKSRYLISNRELLNEAKKFIDGGVLGHGAVFAYVQSSLRQRSRNRVTLVSGLIVSVLVVWGYYVQSNAISTSYYTAATERYSVPEGLNEITPSESPVAMPRYAFKYQRGRLLEVSYVDGFGNLLPSELNGGGSRLKLAYYDDGSVASVQTFSANNQELYTDRFTYSKNAPRAWVERTEESDSRLVWQTINPLNKLTFQYEQETGLDSAARRVIDYDEQGFTQRITLHDAFGNPTQSSSGYTAIEYKRNAHGQPLEQYFIDSAGRKTFDESGRQSLQFSWHTNGKLKQLKENYRDDYRLVTSFSYSDVGLLESKTLTDGEQAEYAEVSYTYSLNQSNYDIREKTRYLAAHSQVPEKQSMLNIRYDNVSGTRAIRASGIEAETVLNDYLSALGGSKWQEITAVEQTLGAEQRVVSEKVLDHGTKWRGHAFMYDCKRVGYAYTVKGAILKTTCYDSDEKVAHNSMGYSVAQFTYDDSLRVKKMDFLDNQHRLTNLRLGFSTVKISYDQSNRIIATRFHNAKGARISDGPAVIKMIYDRYGNEVEMAFFDADEKPTSLDGFQRIERSFNAAGQVTATRYLDVDGDLTMPRELPYAEQHIDYNDKGVIIDEDFYNAKGEIVEPLYGGTPYQNLVAHRANNLEEIAKAARSYRDYDSLRAVGMMYLYGNDDTLPNFVRAEALLRETFENEKLETKAQTANLLGTLYSLSVNDDYSQSGVWYAQSAEYNNIQSMYSLAIHLSQTKGVESNNARALALYSKAYVIYQQPPLDIVFGVIRAGLR